MILNIQCLTREYAIFKPKKGLNTHRLPTLYNLTQSYIDQIYESFKAKFIQYEDHTNKAKRYSKYIPYWVKV